MAKEIKVEVNYSGVGQLLKGEEVKNMLEDVAAKVQANAGTGYGHRVHNTGQRHIANIFAETEEAREDNYNNNTLLRSLHD